MAGLGDWLDSPRRWTLEIYFWSILTVIVVVLSIFFPHIWGPLSIVYLAVVSNYALVLTAGGARQASEARIAASKDNQPSLREIMEYLVKHTTLEKDAGDPDLEATEEVQPEKTPS